jgi:hypothetical protein
MDEAGSSSDDAEEEILRQTQALSAQEYADMQKQDAAELFNDGEAKSARLEVRVRICSWRSRPGRESSILFLLLGLVLERTANECSGLNQIRSCGFIYCEFVVCYCLWRNAPGWRITLPSFHHSTTIVPPKFLLFTNYGCTYFPPS